MSVEGGAPLAFDVIKKATNALGSLPGMSPKWKLRRLAEKLIAMTGWCWFAGIEAVFVIREDGTWGEYHAVAFGYPYGWTNSGRGKWMGRHRDKRVTDVGLPYPDPRQARLVFSIHAGRNKIDTTLTTKGELAYCRAIRMGKHGALPRAGCPVRPEGQEHRAAWERELLGRQTHTCDGVVMLYWNDNPAIAAGGCGGTYETCSEDGAICSTEDLR